MDADTHGAALVELRSVFGFNGGLRAHKRLSHPSATISPKRREKRRLSFEQNLRLNAVISLFLYFFSLKFRPCVFGPEAPPGRRAPDLPSGICGHFEENRRRQARTPARTHRRRLMSVGVQEWIVYSLGTSRLRGLQGHRHYKTAKVI